MKKIYFLLFIFLYCSLGADSQVSNGVLKCGDETFNLLKQVSSSVCSKGEINLSITTHQDLGWVDEVEKCVIMRDTLWMTPFLKRLKEDPEFKMDIEQTSIIIEYLNRHPEKKDEIQKGLDEGRILIGATYTQPYEEMYSGESLVRQLYLGKKWLENNFNGYKSDTYYNSDVPGRTPQMSQILSKSGVKNMFVSRHEKGVFNWYSPDSSKITMFSSGHYIEFYNILAKENGLAITEMAKEVLFWDKYYDTKSKKVLIPALLNYEFGWDQKPVKNCDPFIKLWNSIRSIENTEGKVLKVNLPPFRYGNMNSCLNVFRDNSSKIKSISGERPDVWIYIHGPSHHFAISASREGDILLPDAEKFSAINAMIDGNFRNYDEGKINEAWQAKIYPDHGWGGKGGEITDRLFLSKFVKARDDASAILQSSLQRISSKINFQGTEVPLVVFNGLNWKRNDPVKCQYTFKKGEAFGINLLDASKNPVSIQLSQSQNFDDGSLKSCLISFIASDIPSIGYSTYYVKVVKEIEKPKTSNFNSNFENQFFSIRFGKGGIEMLFDKKLGKEVIETSKFTLGEVFTMQSVGNGAGEFSDVQQPTMQGFDKTGNYNTSWEKVEEGPVFTAFKFRQPVRFAVVEETIIVYHQIKRIDFEIDIKNWQGILYREFRAAFPLNMNSSKITYNVPMGVVEIGKDELKGPAGNIYNTDCQLVHPRTLVDWVNASDSQFGATISSSVLAFDYLDPTTNPTSKTLIQPILFASRKSCHGEGNEYLQLGDHHFSFSLFVSEPGWGNGFRNGKQAQNELYSVLDPIRAQNRTLPEKQSFFSTKGGLTVISALKKSDLDNSIVARFYSLDKNEIQESITSFVKFNQASETNLIEDYISPLKTSNNIINMKFMPFSINTLKF